MATEPHKREAQIRLAEERSLRSRRKKPIEDTKKIANALHEACAATADEIEQGFKNMPTFEGSSQNLYNMACGPWYQTIKRTITREHSKRRDFYQR